MKERKKRATVVAIMFFFLLIRVLIPLQQVSGEVRERLICVGIPTKLCPRLSRDRGPVRQGEAVQRRL